jgi:hypothetical protein
VTTETHVSNRSPVHKSFWIVAVILWLPYLGLFSPWTLGSAANDPWYIRFTSAFFGVSLLYYLPAIWVASLLEGILYIVAFVQSAVLSSLFWMAYPSRNHQTF